MKKFDLVLLIIGIIILGGGAIITGFAGNDVLTFLHSESVPNYKSTIINHTSIQFQPEKLVEFALIDVKTKDIFAVSNPINYTLIAHTTEPDKVSAVFVIDISSEREVPITEGAILNIFVEQANQTGHLVKLDKLSNNVFYKSYIDIPQIDERKKFLMFIEGRTTGAHVLEFDSGLIINPYSAKLQTDTNKAILQQVHETRTTNDRLLGFTIILTSLVPLGIILEKHVNKKN